MADRALCAASASCPLHAPRPCARPAPPHARLSQMPRAAARRAPRQALAARPPGRRAAVRCAAQQAAVGKEIAKTEIPAFVPRLDFITQLLRWAFQESQADGLANFGLPLRITPVYREPDELWGFNAAIIKDGRSATDISVGFDEESTTKYEWVGRGSDGFPIMEGNTDEILGKHLVIRKADDNPIDEEVRETIRGFCEQLVAAINKYYAFGSAFVDDET